MAKALSQLGTIALPQKLLQTRKRTGHRPPATGHHERQTRIYRMAEPSNLTQRACNRIFDRGSAAGAGRGSGGDRWSDRESPISEFHRAVELNFHCSAGWVTSVGKSGIICRKIQRDAGLHRTPSLFLHPRGDSRRSGDDCERRRGAGRIQLRRNRGDPAPVAAIKRLGAGLISIPGNPASSLARHL